jgi:hypothetical protein
LTCTACAGAEKGVISTMMRPLLVSMTSMSSGSRGRKSAAVGVAGLAGCVALALAARAAAPGKTSADPTIKAAKKCFIRSRPLA